MLIRAPKVTFRPLMSGNPKGLETGPDKLTDGGDLEKARNLLKETTVAVLPSMDLLSIGNDFIQVMKKIGRQHRTMPEIAQMFVGEGAYVINAFVQDYSTRGK